MKNLPEIEERKNALKVLRDANLLQIPQFDNLIIQINEHSQPRELALALGFFNYMLTVDEISDPSFLFTLYSKIIQSVKPFKMASTLYILKTLFRQHIKFCIEPTEHTLDSVLFFTDSDNHLCYNINGDIDTLPWVLESALDLSYLESHREEIIRHLILQKKFPIQSPGWIEHSLTKHVSEHPMGFFWALVLSKFNHLNLFETPERLDQLSHVLNYLHHHCYQYSEIFQLWMEIPKSSINMSLLNSLIHSFLEDTEHLHEFCKTIKRNLGVDENKKNQDCIQGRYVSVRIQQEELERISGSFGREFFAGINRDFSMSYFDLTYKVS